MDLWAGFLGHDGRDIHKWKHYFPAYERHFLRFRNQAVTVLEIGCGEGGSLQLWKRFFGPYARIVGIDIRPECAEFEEDQIVVRIGDQADPTFLDAVLAEFGPLNIVIDDGSHRMSDIAAAFAHLYFHRALDPSGVYVVEDLHTAYWANFGGGLGHPDSFIEVAKRHIDELHAYHTRGALAPTRLTDTTLSIHVYDSIVVYERGRRDRNRAFRTGAKGVRADALR